MNIIYEMKNWWWSIDKWILFSTILLLLFGLMLTLSGSSKIEYKYDYPAGYLFNKHIIFVFISLLVILISSMLSVKNLIFFSISFFFIFIILSFLPLFQEEIKGVSRWIKFFNFSIQPSEFLKPTFIIMSALLLSRYKKKEDNSFFLNFLLFSSLGFVLFLQPDFGMFVLFFLTWFAQLILVGLPFKFLSLIIFFGSLIFIISFFTYDHIRFRILNYFNSDVGDNYQVNKAIESFSNGGFFGTGLGGGFFSKRLPDVHSDFIFALAGEELGFVFLCFIIFLYIILFYRVVISMVNEKNLFVFLSASSLILILILQCLINISSAVNLIPTKGMTLPFLSYGGSSLLSCSLIIGFLLALTKKN